ncbi:DUF2975 domain-containing protein [Nocardiopsis coralliicola]
MPPPRTRWLSALHFAASSVSAVLVFTVAILAATMAAAALGVHLPLFQVTVEAVPDTVADALPPGVEPGTTELYLTDPSTADYLVRGGASLIGAGFSLACALLLTRALGAAKTEPFSLLVARRLRAAGMLAVLGGLASALADAVAGAVLLAASPVGGFALAYTVPLGVLAFGAGMLAAAEIIRRGAAMRADLEGTV